MRDGGDIIQPDRHLIALLSASLYNKDLPKSASDWDWVAVLDLAAQTKCVGLVGLSVDRRGLKLPASAASKLAKAQQQLLLTSLFNLEWTIKVVRALQSDGIDVLVLKGPIQSNMVYGRWDISRSSDIDLLVRPQDFAAAGQSLSSHSFNPVLDEGDRWWADHLGEAPYLNVQAGSPMIDLHHRVQQPGGPFPKSPNRFFKDRGTAQFSGLNMPILSKGHGAILAAISYGKAVGEGASWVHYAHELMSVYESLSPAERENLHQLADFHGVHRLLDDALFAATSLFAASELEGVSGASADREPLLHSAFGITNKQRLFRSRKLWDWTDGSPPKRVIEFGRGLLRVWQSEMARVSQERDAANRTSHTA